METAILVLISAVLGGALVGGVAVVWGWEIRTLRLKQRVDGLELSYELVKGQLVAEIKRRAGGEGTAQRARNKEIEDLARTLPTQKIVQELPSAWWETNEKVKSG